MPDPGWYLRRLSRMGPTEVLERVRSRAVVELWRHSDVLDGAMTVAAAGVGPRPLPAAALVAIPSAARSRLRAAADELMGGRARLFGVPRHDLVNPDWFADPRTGRRAPDGVFAFDVPYRDEHLVGDIKQIWELSRHHHLTILAAAWALTHDDRYAERVADHLRSWWAANPPRQGPHWISGIELGIRLISWAWTRRLLEGWPGAVELFEDNHEALHQIYHHQTWLAALPSVGSSANNHVVAEAAGRLVAACAFDWYPQSRRWRAESMRSLVDSIDANTFPSGLNRELATEYHGLVLELGLLGLAEADAAGIAVPARLPELICRQADALAATVDGRLHPPRQGDGDDGHGLVVDAPGTNRWASLLATCAGVFGAAQWWPMVPVDDVRTPLLTALIRPRTGGLDRPGRRPVHFPDAGLIVLRAHPDTGAGEVWLRCDGGPHGFGSIAAHAHADALSVELRIDGVDVLADPGTYCYHGEPQWRSFFRSTAGHNTLELAGRDQSESGGPFLWVRHARSRVTVAHQADGGRGRWTGEHDGYLRTLGARHRRGVVLDPATRTLELRDSVDASAPVDCALNFHLGPTIDLHLDGNVARLHWPDGGRDREARLTLPAGLAWVACRGEVDPPAGWYSPGFGRREPAWQLTGRGRVGADTDDLVSRLEWTW
jgi:hypothetical protein